MKKLTINVTEERMEELLKLLQENDFDWISENSDDFEVPQWQIDEVERRSVEAKKKPEILIPWNQVKSRLERKFK